MFPIAEDEGEDDEEAGGGGADEELDFLDDDDLVVAKWRRWFPSFRCRSSIEFHRDRMAAEGDDE